MRGLPLSVLAATVWACAAAGEPGAPYLVADLAPGREPSYPSQPRGYVPVGGGLAFAADDPEHGRELWWTDGSAVRLLADLDPRPGVGSDPTGMTAMGGRVLCFTASPGMQYRLWSVGADGSAETLASFPRPTTWIGPTAVAASHDRSYFMADDDLHGRELWSTDGTVAGTAMVADLTPGLTGSFVASAVVWNGSLYFQASPRIEPAYPGRLWRADPDGTVEPISTILTSRWSFSYGGPMAVFDGRLFFFHADDSVGESLWSTDGTAEGTRLEVPLLEADDFGELNPSLLVASGRLLIGSDYGNFVLDAPGAPRRDLRVYDLPPIESMTPLGQRALLESAGSLWISDGTDDGTTQLPAEGIAGVIASDGSAAYVLGGSSDGVGLRRVDASGVHPIPGPSPQARFVSHPNRWTPIDAYGGVTVGTFVGAATNPSSTVMLAADDASLEIARVENDRASGSSIQGLLPVDGGVVFLAVGGEERTGLWFSDGTGRGTLLLAEYRLNPSSLQYVPTWASDGLVYFLASDGGPWTLNRSDGTVQGTRAIPLIAPDGTPLHPSLNWLRWPTDLFVARSSDPRSDREWLVLLDRTTGEPRRIEPLEDSTNLVWDVDRRFHVVSGAGSDDYAYFDEETGDRTPILTPEGTSVSGWLAPAGGRVYFLGLTQSGDQYEYAAWVSDGPGVMSRRLLPLSSSGQMSFFSAGERAVIMQDAGDGVDVWVTEPDGSAATPLGRFAYFDRNNGFEVAGFGGEAFFVPLDLATGREVWRAGPGASVLTETIAGPDGAATNLRNLGRLLAFTAPGAAGGPELWLSDGTPGGTRPLSAFTGSTRVLDGREAAVSGGLLFLTGSTPETGVELWAVRLCAPDFNGDRLVDFADYDGFAGAFEAGDRAADFNADGFLDFFDYADFVAAFERGC